MVPLHKDGSYGGCTSQILPHATSFDPARDVPSGSVFLMSEILVFDDYRQFILLFTQSGPRW